MRCLYILEVNPLLMHYLQIFSPFSRLSVLLMVSFAMQKLLNLIRSHLFIFASNFITLGSQLIFDRKKKDFRAVKILCMIL